MSDGAKFEPPDCRRGRICGHGAAARRGGALTQPGVHQLLEVPAALGHRVLLRRRLVGERLLRGELERRERLLGDPAQLGLELDRAASCEAGSVGSLDDCHGACPPWAGVDRRDIVRGRAVAALAVRCRFRRRAGRRVRARRGDAPAASGGSRCTRSRIASRTSGGVNRNRPARSSTTIRAAIACSTTSSTAPAGARSAASSELEAELGSGDRGRRERAVRIVEASEPGLQQRLHALRNPLPQPGHGALAQQFPEQERVPAGELPEIRRLP